MGKVVMSWGWWLIVIGYKRLTLHALVSLALNYMYSESPLNLGPKTATTFLA